MTPLKSRFNIHAKLVALYHEFYSDLSDWDRDFIDTIYEGVSPESIGLLPDDDLNQYLTNRQMGRIDKIWDKVDK